MPVVDRVRQFVRQHDLAQPGARVLVALSGGSDSVALVHLLRELHVAGDLVLVGVVHLNHQLRPGAERDARFSTAIADAFGLPAFVERADVAARARRERRSLEDAAHAARYELFERARLTVPADVVALGHTKDDQAETVLLRLLRGAGSHGLAGMYPRNGTVVRPLLGCRRSELRDYLDARRIVYVEDESNRDVDIARNRVRVELLPLLEARFNPAVVDVLGDEATLARETSQWIGEVADELFDRVVRPLASATDVVARCEIDVPRLKAAPRAVVRAVLWRAMNEASGRRPIAFAHVDAALALVEGGRDNGFDAPGQRVERIGAHVVLTSRPAGTVGRWLPKRDRAAGGDGDGEIFFRYPLPIPGEVRLPEAGCVVSAEPVGAEETAGPRAILGIGEHAVVRHDRCPGPLAVRNRRPGDQFRPVGLGGKKKLQDFFVDRKIARDQRDAVPLVVDESDRIVWVAGYGIDEAFEVTDPAQGVLLLRLRLVGGSA